MVTESLACPSCAETVPPGRLSCPHCGTVLAAVARRVEVTDAIPPGLDDEEPALEPEPEPYARWPMAAAPAPLVEAAPPVAVPSPFASAGTYVPSPFNPHPHGSTRAPGIRQALPRAKVSLRLSRHRVFLDSGASPCRGSTRTVSRKAPTP
jgi:hypothetical protein